MQPKLSAKSPTIYHVVGPDLERSLISSLTPGDKILVEVNGEGQFRTSPIMAEIPWEVVEVTDNFLSITHPDANEVIKLPFDTILKTNKGPAVFKIERNDPSIPYWLVILQFIAYRTDTSPHEYDPAEYIEHFSDAIIKKELLTAWCRKLASFKWEGWGHNTVKRFALRANISPAVVDAFRGRDWSVINSLSVDMLLQIARELEYLPSFLELDDDIQHNYCPTGHNKD